MTDITCQTCGLINDYHEVQKNIHVAAYCNGCDSYIKNLPQGKPFILPFGKFKGVLLSDMVSKDQTDYLHWMLRQSFNNNIKTKVSEHLKTLEPNV